MRSHLIVWLALATVAPTIAVPIHAWHHHASCDCGEGDAAWKAVADSHGCGECATCITSHFIVPHYADAPDIVTPPFTLAWLTLAPHEVCCREPAVPLARGPPTCNCSA